MSWRRGSDWDGGDDWDYPATPRRPSNGIKAQTQRGKFSATWWAERWLAALEDLVNPGRLSRGRSYARSGQVVKLDVGSQGVDARVQGSRPRPYDVAIRFRRLSDAEWDNVADVMAVEAIFAARLLSGEMPEQIEEAFQAAGATLFPAGIGDLETGCTCPDWANPCKHVAAVYYLLGERFDADPFLIFELRGRTKDEITGMLRARWASAGARDASVVTAATEVGAEPAEVADEPESAVPLLTERDGDSPVTVGESFWSASVILPEIAITFDPPALDALPVKLLGAPPFWPEEQEFTNAMERVYRVIGEQARRLALEGK